MSAVARSLRATAAGRGRHAVVGRGGGTPRWLRWLGSKLLTVWAVVALAFLFIPIVVVVAFSFNEPGSVDAKGVFHTDKYNYSWGRLSFDAWRHPFKYTDMTHAFMLSVQIALIATFISVVLGTLMALSLVKYKFRGKGPVSTFLILPLTMPEVVLGFSLLTLFVAVNVDRGFLTIIVAHVMFCVSYVTTTVKARIRGFDWRLEEAAADLGATPVRTFREVTLPLIAPGVAAAALLTFALSLDDFVITYLNSGKETTFPIQIWNQKRSSIPPQINVFGTLVLIVSGLLAVAGLLVQRRRDRLVA